MPLDPYQTIVKLVEGEDAPTSWSTSRAARDEPPASRINDIDFDLARFATTDLGNVERFVRRHGHELLFCEKLGWLYWDGRRWASDGADAQRRLAEHRTVRAIQDEAEALRQAGEGVEAERLAKWGRLSETAGRMGAISDRAAHLLRVCPDDLDADPMKFNIENGTLVFARREEGDYVELKPHDPADRITKLAPVRYDPQAVCPLYDRFLDEVQPRENDGGAAQRFLHQWGGLALTGDTGQQKLTFHYGTGRNGKSVWISTLADVIGDYARTMRIETILESGRPVSGAQASPDIAMLKGVRFLVTSEPGKGAVLAESLIKQLTGEDRITARQLHRDFFEFRPEAKLTMQGNYRPKISGTDEGIWGRVILVPWKVFIPPERRDPELQRKLAAEASGILNRLLDGLRDFMDHGLVLPDSVCEATQDYRSDSDPLGRFLEACTRPTSGARVQASEMHRLFGAWARASGESEWSAKGLGGALKDRGFRSLKSSSVFWLDIELTRSPLDFSSHANAGESDEERVDHDEV